MKVVVQISGIEGIVDVLKSLPPELVSKRGGVAAASMRKGARLISEQARSNVRQVVVEPNVDGLPSRSTGRLEKSIVAARVRNRTGQPGEQFIVWTGPKLQYRYGNTRLNRRRSRVGKAYAVDNPRYYGRFLEYGTSKMSAHRWLVPAFKARAQQAIEVITSDMIRSINRIVKRLSWNSKGR